MWATYAQRERWPAKRRTPDSSEVPTKHGCSNLQELAHAAPAKEVSHVPNDSLIDFVKIARDIIRLALEVLRLYKSLKDGMPGVAAPGLFFR